MKIKQVTYSCAAAVIALAACEKLQTDAGGKILCTVNVASTRGVPVTTASIKTTGFVMDAYASGAYHDNETDTDYSAGKYFSKSVTYASSAWSISDSPKWINGVGINFFCHAPQEPAGSLAITKSDEDTSDEMTFNYTAPVPATNANTEDLVFAYKSQTVEYESDGSLKSGSESVDLTFYHALSQIRFCLSTDDGTFPSDMKLISIVLKGAKQTDGTYPGMIASGSCVYKGSTNIFTWTTGTEMSNYTQTFGPAVFNSGTPSGWVLGSYVKDSNTYNLYTCTGNVLFIIPQDHDNCAVDITMQKGTADSFTVTAKLPDTDPWEAGKYYSYKIKASKNLSLSLMASDWISGSEDLSF